MSIDEVSSAKQSSILAKRSSIFANKMSLLSIDELSSAKRSSILAKRSSILANKVSMNVVMVASKFGSVVGVGVVEGTEAVPRQRRRMFCLLGGCVLERCNPLLSTCLHDSKIHIVRVGEEGETPVIHRVINQEIGQLIGGRWRGGSTGSCHVLGAQIHMVGEGTLRTCVAMSSSRGGEGCVVTAAIVGVSSSSIEVLEGIME